MRTISSGMCLQPCLAGAAMPSLPDVSDHEADHTADKSAGQNAAEGRDLERIQAARRRAATHAGEDHRPRRERPPQASEDPEPDREALRQLRAPRLVIVVRDRTEALLLFSPAAVAH